MDSVTIQIDNFDEFPIKIEVIGEGAGTFYRASDAEDQLGIIHYRIMTRRIQFSP